MILIDGITIENFRSIKYSQESLSNLGNHTTFAGLNNSGKSNILRALNVFFNNYTDTNTPLVFEQDYYRYDIHKKLAIKQFP